MRKFLLVFCLLVGAGGLILGCSAPASPSPQPPTVEAIVTEVFSATPTTISPSPTEELEPTEAPFTQDPCVACHSNQQRITDTAKPKEDTEGESKGVG